MHEGLQKIGRAGFSSCTSLSSITFPYTVTEIGEWAFQCCDNLREAMFNEGLQKIGKFAFYNCASLSTVTLPSTLIEIEKEAY